jgi:ketosteroid isomerase-like protein
VFKNLRQKFVALVVAASVASQLAPASASETGDITALLGRYFAVTSERDVSKLEEFWVHDSQVVLVFPSDKEAAVGWEAVKKSYQARFDTVSEWKLTPKEPPIIQVRPSMAVTTTKVLIQATSKSTGAPVTYTLYFTQVFVQRDNKWQIVESHGSRVPE